MEDTPKFNNYKEEQAYWRDKYENRGTIVHISKVIDKNGKVLQPGKTYHSDKGDLRRYRKRARAERKHNAKNI